jgi:hypothetical protein
VPLAPLRAQRAPAKRVRSLTRNGLHDCYQTKRPREHAGLSSEPAYFHGTAMQLIKEIAEYRSAS